MDAAHKTSDNPEGLDRFDPVFDEGFAASVQAYSDRFRRLRGRPSIRLGLRDQAPIRSGVEPLNPTVASPRR